MTTPPEARLEWAEENGRPCLKLLFVVDTIEEFRFVRSTLEEAGLVKDWGVPGELDETFQRATHTHLWAGVPRRVGISVKLYDEPVRHGLPGVEGPTTAFVHVEATYAPEEPAYFTDPSFYISAAIGAGITLATESALKAAWAYIHDKLRKKKEPFVVDEWRDWMKPL